MRKIRSALIVLPFLFVACASESEVPVEEVRTCSNVVRVELVMRSGPSSSLPLLPRERVEVKLTLENGQYVYNDRGEYGKWDKDNNLLKTATRMEMGQEHCFTTDYKPIK